MTRRVSRRLSVMLVATSLAAIVIVVAVTAIVVIAVLGLAARHADRWNTFGGFGINPEEAVRGGREDNARLDELCAETGRTVRRSALIGYPFNGETPWRSDEAFADVVGRWEDAGFEELVFYYPPEWATPEGSVEPGVFERMLGKG